MKAVSRFVVPLMLALTAGSGLAHAAPMHLGNGVTMGHHALRMDEEDRALFGCDFIDETLCRSARANNGTTCSCDMSLLDRSHTLSGVTMQ